MIDDELLTGIEEPDEHSAIARLIELGRQKSYVTIDDILAFFPDAERDLDQLEEAYAALLAAGVTYLDEVAETEEGPEEDLIEDEIGRAHV